MEGSTLLSISSATLKAYEEILHSSINLLGGLIDLLGLSMAIEYYGGYTTGEECSKIDESTSTSEFSAIGVF